MYFYEFRFGTEKKENDEITFSVFLVNDTGYFQAHKEDESIKQISVSEFADVEHSKSELIFVVSKNLREVWGDEWKKPEFILEGEGMKGDEKANKFMVFKHYSLADFIDEEGAVKSLRDFEKYCKEHNIDFSMQETIIK